MHTQACFLGVLFVVAGCGSSGSQHGAAGSNAGGSSAGGSGVAGAAGSAPSVTGGAPSTAGSGGTGGSIDGSGGGGGSETPPPHEVSACPNVGTDKVGVWEEVTPPDVMRNPGFGGTQAVVVDPHNPAVVYMAGSGLSGGAGGIYKSTDCGATWKKVDTGAGGSQIDSGAPWSMVIDPIDPEVLYAVDGYGANGLFKTTDGGVSWTQLFPPDSQVAQTAAGNFASIVSIDPTLHLHLVVSFHSGCSGPTGPNCLAETKDGGATWRLVKGPSEGGEGAGPMVLNDATWLYGVPFGGLFLTQDSGQTWTKVAGGSHYELYHAKDGTYYLGSIGGVLHSNDGLAWNPIKNSGGQLQGIIGDGRTIFVSQQNGSQYFTAPENSPVTWTGHAVPGNNGSYWMAYDGDHHILYTTGGKLFRMVTY